MLPNELRELIPAGRVLRSVEPIGGSGSSRRYWRLHFAQGPDLIATSGTNQRENEAFIYLASKLGGAGVIVPEVVAVSPSRMDYLQTDVGAVSLFDNLDRLDLVAGAIDLLARVHMVDGIDYSRCFPVAEMNRRAIMWDLNYFKYCFLKTSPGVEIDEPALEDDFERLAGIILQCGPRGFMVRDFQSRNVMIDDCGHPALIDFQGGRLGPAHYDVVSFLWQARAGFPADVRARMISRYCRARGLDEVEFSARVPYFVVLRLLQALGAYGFRGRFEGKEHFLRSIAPALQSLRATLATMPGEFPAIAAAIAAAG